MLGPAFDDEEGARVPDGLPEVVDAHVHLFPDRLFQAVQDWFGVHGWPIRYPLRTPGVISFLLSRGVSRLVALHYAHKPGIARSMNAYVAEVCRAEPRVHGVATVFPGEEGAVEILEEGFRAGLCGVKLHCHVQCVAADDPAMAPIYDACSRSGKPLVMHAGREPRSPAYRCDTHALCSAARVADVLRDFPRLPLVIPHLGIDELDDYRRLLDRHDNLWLDTTMTLAGYFPGQPHPDLLAYPAERVLYGTDFPNIPFAWDRELRAVADAGLGAEALRRVLGGNARALFFPQGEGSLVGS